MFCCLVICAINPSRFRDIGRPRWLRLRLRTRWLGLWLDWIRLQTGSRLCIDSAQTVQRYGVSSDIYEAVSYKASDIKQYALCHPALVAILPQRAKSDVKGHSLTLHQTSGLGLSWQPAGVRTKSRNASRFHPSGESGY